MYKLLFIIIHIPLFAACAVNDKRVDIQSAKYCESEIKAINPFYDRHVVNIDIDEDIVINTE